MVKVTSCVHLIFMNSAICLGGKGEVRNNVGNLLFYLRSCIFGCIIMVKAELLKQSGSKNNDLKKIVGYFSSPTTV